MDKFKIRAVSAMAITLSAGMVFLPTSTHCRAAALKPADVIVSWAGYPASYVQEYTRTGALVQSWTITSSWSSENARDVGVDWAGNIVIYNGTFNPTLTILNPTTGDKTNYSFPGWNTINNTTMGGLAVWGGYAYATDDEIGSDGPNQNGVVRFNLANGAADRFLAGTDTTAIGIGLNDTLYAVGPDTSPGENELDIINPTTMVLEKTVAMPFSLSGVTADAAGNIYATSGSTIYKLDSNGNILGSLETTFALDNIKISPTDQLIMANNGGQIVLSSTSLSSYTEFTLNEPGAQLYESYATFVPEPTVLSLLTIGAYLLLLKRRQREFYR